MGLTARTRRAAAIAATDEALMIRLEDDMDMHSRRGAGLIAGMLIGAGLAVGPGQMASAQDYWKEGQVRWSFDRDWTPQSGWGQWLKHAMADDQPSPVDHRFDQVGNFGTKLNIASKLALDGTVKDDTPVPEEHGWARTSFDISLVPATYTEYFTTPAAHAKVATASAEGDSTLELRKSGKELYAKYRVSGQHLEDTLIPNQDDKDGETNIGHAFSAFGVRYDTRIAKSEFKGYVSVFEPLGFIVLRNGTDPLPTRVKRSASAGTSTKLTFLDNPPEGDPVQLGFSEVYKDAFDVSGEASITWDPLGDILITAGAGGTASILLSTPSNWVLNPLNASALAANGEFTVGGLFTGLPWDVTVSGNVITARLPVSAIPHSFEFICDVSSLGPSAGDVTALLDSDSSGQAEDLDTVIPSPGTLTLLVLAGLVAVRRQRA